MQVPFSGISTHAPHINSILFPLRPRLDRLSFGDREVGHDCYMWSNPVRVYMFSALFNRFIGFSIATPRTVFF